MNMAPASFLPHAACGCQPVWDVDAWELLTFHYWWCDVDIDEPGLTEYIPSTKPSPAAFDVSRRHAARMFLGDREGV